ncbi:uncharacterized protein LOC133336264 [Musca vetustissima]|uniref:uncharacterized protein LOC133329508 n=1 Tax=Musca vetustissima TaxID=27455 RepID=UPI002AB60E47|nr:uncharacterized protein LOC133329508 [Musca vetustissima]XP_061400531.1 uncharacterized protein LOC133336264 [Musca vetustissima]
MSRIIEIIDSDDDTTAPTKTSSNSANENSPAQSRRRPRKSVLQTIDDPEVQFQTIAVEDEDGGNSLEDSSVLKSNPIGRSTTRLIPKTTPKILAPKPPSNADAIQAAFDEYVNRSETKECMTAIALERVRVNYLLNLFGMPEINFSLYTQPEILKFQFEERLKQQKMMQNVGNRARNQSKPETT